MRLNIEFQFSGRLQLPLNYESILQGFLYRKLSNKDYAKFLHETGYRYEKRAFKLFTFSRLQGTYEVDGKNKKIGFYSPVNWSVASVLPEFIEDVGQSLLMNDNHHIQSQKVKVASLQYDVPRIPGPNCSVRMLSPITVYSTVERENGKKITRFFAPEEEEFSRLIKRNLRKKYEAYYGKPLYNDEFQITPLRVTRKDKVVTRFKTFIINAWGGEYRLQGSEELLHVALGAGLGGRNSQGFGMAELKNTN